MANLTRYLQKIFANNSDEVGVFGTGVNKQVSKNVETLQSAEYEGGWSEAIITNKNYPIWQEMDGVQYGFSYQLAYLLQKGLPEWIATETYYTNDYCRVGSTIYYSLQDNNIGKNPTSETTYWTPLLTSNRSIGQIVPSTISLTEAGLHLLDGSLIQGTGIYADFVTYMANLTATQPDIFTTEATWQSTVTTYGVCGKFVYDSVNNTIRLPKITGIVEGTTDLTALGDLVEAGLPNITGIIGGISSQSNTTSLIASGSFNVRMAGAAGGYGTSKSSWQDAFDLDASRSSSIYGNSSTVQPQAIKILYYIVIATSTKTDIEVDIDEIATDLNSKADIDLSNTSATGKNRACEWLTPDYANGITVAASNANEQSYTAPSIGWFNFTLWSQGSTSAYVMVNDYPYAIRGDNSGSTSTVYESITGSILVNKNDVIKFRTSKSVADWGNYNYFYPAKGGN